MRSIVHIAFLLLLTTLVTYTQDTLRFESCDTIMVLADHGAIVLNQQENMVQIVHQNTQPNSFKFREHGNSISVHYKPNAWNFGNEKFYVNVSSTTVVIAEGLDVSFEHIGLAKAPLQIKTVSGNIEIDSLKCNEESQFRSHTGNTTIGIFEGKFSHFTTVGEFTLIKGLGELNHERHGLQLTLVGAVSDIRTSKAECEITMNKSVIELTREFYTPQLAISGSWNGRFSLQEKELELENNNTQNDEVQSLFVQGFDGESKTIIQGRGVEVRVLKSLEETVYTSDKKEKRSGDDRFQIFYTEDNVTARLNLN